MQLSNYTQIMDQIQDLSDGFTIKKKKYIRRLTLITMFQKTIKVRMAKMLFSWVINNMTGKHAIV